jgi:hypothetical protein
MGSAFCVESALSVVSVFSASLKHAACTSAVRPDDLGFGDAAAGRLASGCWRAGGAQTLSRRPLVMAEMAIRSELARTQTRTNSLIIVDTLDVVHQQSKKLRNDGASATTFFFGVCNVAFSAFIAGRMPEYYWVWNTFKMFFFFPLRIKRQLEQGSIGQQIEICWLSNVLIVGMLTIAFVDEYVTNEMLPPEMLRRGFLFFFMLAAGPLGWSIVVLGNSLLCARPPLQMSRRASHYTV